jgi:hypothetical protein
MSGRVKMSERDLRRKTVLSDVISGRRTIMSAASILAVSVGHVHRFGNLGYLSICGVRHRAVRSNADLPRHYDAAGTGRDADNV